MREKLEKGVIYHLIWNKKDPDTRSFCIFEAIGDRVSEHDSGVSDVFTYFDCNEPEKPSPYFLIVSHMTIERIDSIRPANIRKSDDFIERITKEQAYRLMVSYIFTKLNPTNGSIMMFDRKIR